jgi:predicted Zn-dependent protease
MLKSFGKNASRIRVTEEEADRLGLRLAWAAGYDPTAALTFWQRYYAKHDNPLQLFRTHPSLGARAKLMRETVAELEREPRPGAAAAANR